MQTYPTSPAMIAPMIQQRTSIPEIGSDTASLISRTDAPRIAGTDIRNEYLTAKRLSNPLSRHAVMVVPERERPGNVARPCAIPMKKPLE